MKKEYLVSIAVALFIFAYVLDWISGPVSVQLRNPFGFLSMAVISLYPFTAVSVAIRAIALLISVILGASLFSQQYLVKGITFIVTSALAELYVIQQLATGMRLISIQWILAVAVFGLGLLVPGVIFLILGLLHWGHDQISGSIYNVETNKDDQEN